MFVYKKFKFLMAILCLSFFSSVSFALSWTENSHEIYLVDFNDNGVASDILLEGVSRKIEIPYGMYVEIPSEYESFVLIKDENGQYSLMMLGKGERFNGEKLSAGGYYDIRLQDVTGDGRKELNVSDVSGVSSNVVVRYNEADGKAYVSQSYGDNFSATGKTEQAKSFVITYPEPATLVGATQGSFAVSQTGAATYNLPISVSPGLNGHQPNLALSYNSRSGNGLLGEGWNLSGLVSVRRCSSSPLYEGDVFFDGVTLKDSDRLCLNGQRLILVDGEDYWADGAVFRTEIDNKKVVERAGEKFEITTGEGHDLVLDKLRPEVWAVSEHRDQFGVSVYYKYHTSVSESSVIIPSRISYGEAEIIFEYGNRRNDFPSQYIGGQRRSLDSYLKTVSVKMAGEKLRDYDLHYDYATSSGALTLNNIQMCGYESNGVSRKCALPLAMEQIESKNEFSKKDYSLKSSFNPANTSQLAYFDWSGNGVADLIRAGEDGSVEVRFGVPEGSNEPFTYKTILESSDNNYHITPYIADSGERGVVYMNGEWGESSNRIVLESSYNKVIARPEWKQIGTCRTVIHSGNVSGFTTEYSPWGSTRDSHGRYPTKRECDNGKYMAYYEGVYEFVPAVYGYEYYDAFQYKWNKITSGSDGEASPPKTILSGEYCPKEEEDIEKFDPRKNLPRPMLGDFNSNGRTQMLALRMTCSSGNWRHVVGNGSHSPDIDVLRSIPFAFDGRHRTYMAERLDGRFVFRMGEVNGQILKTVSGQDIPSDYAIFADLNGDGLSDVVSFGQKSVGEEPDNNFIYIYMNKGGKWADPVKLDYSSIPSLGRGLGGILDLAISDGGPISDRIRVFDYNGNGINDLLVINGESPAHSASGNKLFVLQTVTNADKDPAFEVVDLGITNHNTTDLENKVVVFDADGDGRSDILIANGSSYELFGQEPSFGGTVSGFVTVYPNGDKVRTKVEYSRLNDPDVHDFTWSRKDGYRTTVGPMSVVASVSMPVKKGVQDTVSYTYKDAKQHLLGRGFLGFESYTQESELSKRKATYDFYGTDLDGGNGFFPEFPYIGALVRKTVENTANGALIEVQNNSWSSEVEPPVSVNYSGVLAGDFGIKHPYISHSFSQNYDLEGNAISATLAMQTVDAYGNPSTQTTKVGSSSSNPRTCIPSSSCALDSIEHSTTENYRFDTWNPNFLSALDVMVDTPSLYYPGMDASLSRELTTSYVFRPQQGLPNVVGTRTTQTGPNSADSVTETFLYSTHADGRGQLLRETFASGNDVPVLNRIQDRRVVINSYQFGLYPAKITNALGHTESVQVDPRSSQPTRVTHADGRIDNFQYDPLGRNIRTMKAEGLTVAREYSFCGNDSCPEYAQGAVIRVKTSGSDGTEQVVYLDAFNREVANTNRHFDGDLVIAHAEYDERGRVSSTSLPYRAGENPTFTTYVYSDVRNKVIVTHPDQSTTTTTAVGTGSGQRTTETKVLLRDQPDSGGATVDRTLKTVKRRDARGNVVEVSEAENDAHFVTTGMAYDAKNRLVWTQVLNASDGESPVTTIVYDDLNNTKTLNDPGTGVTVTTYNSAGEVVREVQKGLDNTNEADRAIAYDYDRLGRRFAREVEGTGSIALWYYDQDASGESCGIGRLCEKVAPFFAEHYTYEQGKGLLTETLTSLSNKDTGSSREYRFAFTYDGVGREKTATYPSGLAIKRQYRHGFPSQVTDISEGSDNTVLWQAEEYSIHGAPQVTTLGNGLSVTHSFDERGRMRGIATGLNTSASDLVQSVAYGYDSAGNLAYRRDSLSNHTETFQYDSLNRLVGQVLDSGGSQTTTHFAYNDLGNITSKGAITDYRYSSYSQSNQCTQSGQYSAPGPHAVREANGNVYCYDQFGNQVSGGGRSVTYSAFNKPTRVTKGSTTISYRYGPDEARFYQHKETATESVERFYVAGGRFEEVIVNGVSTQKSYVDNFLIDKRSDNKVTQLYTLRDHLGSVDTIVGSDLRDGLETAVIERLSFGPFGERRLDGRSGTTLSPQSGDRGFTDHEHMDEVGLIHMNGRIYDPELGRFMSADPFVQAPWNSQSYNRYSYTWNNPLSNVDPSGYTSLSLDPAVETWISDDVINVAPNPHYSGSGSSSGGSKLNYDISPNQGAGNTNELNHVHNIDGHTYNNNLSPRINYGNLRIDHRSVSPKYSVVTINKRTSPKIYSPGPRLQGSAERVDYSRGNSGRIRPLSELYDKNSAVLTMEGDLGLGLRPRLKLGKLAELSVGGRLSVAGWAEFFSGGDAFFNKGALDIKLRIWRLELGYSAGGWETYIQNGVMYERSIEGWKGYNIILPNNFSAEAWSLSVDIPLGVSTVSGELNMENVFQ